MLSKITILNAIFENKGYDVFKNVASTHNAGILRTELQLSRKQYYSRMSRLIEAGLVKRQNGRYLLTGLGKVIYNAHMNLEAKIETALSNYWKLKAVDSLGISSLHERTEIVSELIDNTEIKSILMKEEPSSHEQAVIEKPHVLLLQKNPSAEKHPCHT